MIYSLTVTNSIGESLTFELSNPLASGYAIKTIDGLGTPDMNVNTTPYGIGDGSVLGSIKAEYRLITIILYPLAAPTVETTRQKLYRYFQIKKAVVLSFNTENRLVTIDGYVQKIEPNIFDNPESISIEIKCINPYFHKMTKDKTNFYGVVPKFEFPFSTEFEYTDGIGWSKDAYSGVILWNGFSYGEGRFVGSGYDKEGPLAYSSGGTSWVKVAMPVGPDVYWASPAYGDGKFVSMLPDSNIGAYSFDGVDWELFSLPFSADWAYIAYGNEIFIAIPSSGTTGVYSYNGIDWYSIDLGTDGKWTKLIFGNNIFVAIQGNNNLAIYSNNGQAWERVGYPVSGSYYDVACVNSVFIFTSSGGSSWLRGIDLNDLQSIPRPLDGKCIIGNAGDVFLAIKENSNEAVYSKDGLTWDETTLPAATDWKYIGYGNEHLVVLAGNGYATRSEQAYRYLDLIEFSTYTIDNSAEIEYEGEIDAGLRITIECQSSPGDIIIYNIDTLDYIQIFAERVEAVSGFPLGPKDIVEINTESGNKYVRLLRNGIYYNILGAMNRGMTWFTLKQGPNKFTYTTSEEHAAIIMSFSYNDTYAAI